MQIEPSFHYANTLSGHEYVANEDFDKVPPLTTPELPVWPQGNAASLATAGGVVLGVFS